MINYTKEGRLVPVGFCIYRKACRQTFYYRKKIGYHKHFEIIKDTPFSEYISKILSKAEKEKEIMIKSSGRGHSDLCHVML
jgi:hypothetical protein